MEPVESSLRESRESASSERGRGRGGEMSSGSRDSSSGSRHAIAADGASTPPDDSKMYSPLNWSPRRKWTAFVGAAAMTFSSTLITVAYDAIAVPAEKGLPATDIEFLLGNTTFLSAVGLAPLFLAPLSENSGRKKIFAASALISALLMIPQALAPNIEAILISRFFQGCAASAGISMTGGIVSDLWSKPDRALPMSVLALVVFVVQGIGPLASAWTAQRDGRQAWRISLAWQGGIALLCAAVVIFLVPETREDIVIAKATGGNPSVAKKASQKPFLQRLWISTARPIGFLFSEPIVTVFSLWFGFLWACVFIAFQSVSISFGTAYGWTAAQSSIVFLVIPVGSTIAFIINFIQESYYRRVATTKYNNAPPPEERLWTCCLGAILTPVGLFWFAWTCRSGINPAASIVALVVFACGIFPIYMASFLFLSDVYQTYASSAVAAQSCVRNLLAGAVLFVNPMYNNLGSPIATSILAAIAALLGLTPFILVAFGARLRRASRVAASLDDSDEVRNKAAPRTITAPPV